MGRRFEDHQNRLEVGDAVVVDVSASTALTRWAELFLVVENLFDTAVEVGRTTDGVTATGPPRLILGGLRIRF